MPVFCFCWQLVVEGSCVKGTDNTVTVYPLDKILVYIVLRGYAQCQDFLTSDDSKF